MMEATKTSYNDLAVKAITLLDDDDKVRRYLMETTRILKALAHSDVVYNYERRPLELSYWRFVLCYNLTPTMNRATARKIFARFVGGYCEGLEPATADILAMLFEGLAESIHKGEGKDAQQQLLDSAVTYLLRQ